MRGRPSWGIRASDRGGSPMRRHRYQVIVDGELRAIDRDWLADLEIRRLQGGRTALRGSLDQSALHGLLNRLQYLALEVVGVRRECGCAGRGACRATA